MASLFCLFILFLQRCSPPALVLSLSPGLGPDGLPSPGGYFPHAAGSGSGAGANMSPNSLALAGSCSTPPLLMSVGHPTSHRSSPCNDFIAAAMRSTANPGEILNFFSLLVFPRQPEPILRLRVTTPLVACCILK
jgi:hypothetical protein